MTPPVPRRLRFLLQCAQHLLARAAAGARKWLRLSRLGCAVWRWRAVARYCLTGNCGLACGTAAFRQVADGTPVDLFVPEAGCPIHDERTWVVTLIDGVKAAVALARDFCESMYASYPDEAVEEEFAQSLHELGRDEERGPWRTGYW